MIFSILKRLGLMVIITLTILTITCLVIFLLKNFTEYVVVAVLLICSWVISGNVINKHVTRKY